MHFLLPWRHHRQIQGRTCRKRGRLPFCLHRRCRRRRLRCSRTGDRDSLKHPVGYVERQPHHEESADGVQEVDADREGHGTLLHRRHSNADGDAGGADQQKLRQPVGTAFTHHDTSLREQSAKRRKEDPRLQT